LFAPTVSRTDPLPEPAPPEVTVIHETLLTAVHVHPTDAVTATVTSSPAAATDDRSGATA
jgi:hypothetical protein